MELHVPDLAEPYRTALIQAVQFACNEYSPVGIVASGSILRGEGHASSDLDIYVIHEQNWRQRVQRFFNGVPVEIFVNPPIQIRRYFVSERREGRPLTAHMFVTGIVVLDRDGIVEQLRREAEEALRQPPGLSSEVLTVRRYMAATALEDAADILTSDPINAQMILEHAMFLLIQYAFLAADRPLPRWKQMLDGLTALDMDLGELAQRFYTESTLQRRFSIAEQFARQTIGVTGFFAWETERQEVQP